MASSVNYDSDVLPEKIIIYFNSIRLNEKYSEIITNFGKFQSDNDIDSSSTSSDVWIMNSSTSVSLI